MQRCIDPILEFSKRRGLRILPADTALRSTLATHSPACEIPEESPTTLGIIPAQSSQPSGIDPRESPEHAGIFRGSRTLSPLDLGIGSKMGSNEAAEHWGEGPMLLRWIGRSLPAITQ